MINLRINQISEEKDKEEQERIITDIEEEKKEILLKIDEIYIDKQLQSTIENYENKAPIVKETLVKGVNELYGDDARRFRKLLRSFEDTLESRGFEQLIPGILSTDEIFKQNLNFLGERFMKNLVYTSLNGEDNVVILPEGTMRTYDFIKRKGLNSAKIFYSEQFVRNESIEDVIKGKTRAFWQTGFEIFNYPLLESSIEAMETVYYMIKNAGIEDVVIRYSDKRLIKGMLELYSPEDQEKIRKIMDAADDSPEKFEMLYYNSGGKNPNIKYLVEFIALGLDKELSIKRLSEYCKTNIFEKGLEFMKEIKDNISKDVKVKVLPFMAKSWDACDMLLFDARTEGYECALAGGGNLTYNNYKPEAYKSGAGIGTTRVYEVLKKKN